MASKTLILLCLTTLIGLNWGFPVASEDNVREMEMEELVDDEADEIDDEYPDDEDAEGMYDDEDYAEENEDMKGVEYNIPVDY